MKTLIPNKEKYDFISDKYLHINSCGRSINSGYEIIRRNGRSDYHLLYVCSGSCVAEYEGAKSVLKDGDFIIYYPGQTQKYSFETNAECVTLWVHFSGKVAEDILNETGLLSGVYFCEADSKISDIFTEMVDEFRICKDLHESAENGLFVYMLTRLSRKLKTENNVRGLENVIIHMHNNFAGEYNPEIYANMCLLGKSRFSHKFKEHYGIPPHKYFIELKIEKAKELLKFSNLGIGEIAQNVGYENPLYFSRIFKKHTTLSPSEYRIKSAEI